MAVTCIVVNVIMEVSLMLRLVWILNPFKQHVRPGAVNPVLGIESEAKRESVQTDLFQL